MMAALTKSLKKYSSTICQLPGMQRWKKMDAPPGVIFHCCAIFFFFFTQFLKVFAFFCTIFDILAQFCTILSIFCAYFVCLFFRLKVLPVRFPSLHVWYLFSEHKCNTILWSESQNKFYWEAKWNNLAIFVILEVELKCGLGQFFSFFPTFTLMHFYIHYFCSQL